VLAVILSKDGKLAISASADGSIIIWEVSQSKKIATFKDHGDAVLSIALTPDGTQIIR
jgi:WD40 repeat protein